jgi:hypothetical protein
MLSATHDKITRAVLAAACALYAPGQEGCAARINVQTASLFYKREWMPSSYTRGRWDAWKRGKKGASQTPNQTNQLTNQTTKQPTKQTNNGGWVHVRDHLFDLTRVAFGKAAPDLENLAHLILIKHGVHNKERSFDVRVVLLRCCAPCWAVGSDAPLVHATCAYRACVCGGGGGGVR